MGNPRGGHQSGGLATLYRPGGNGGQTILGQSGCFAVVELNIGGHSDGQVVGLDPGQVSRGCAGRVGHLFIGAVGLEWK